MFEEEDILDEIFQRRRQGLTRKEFILQILTMKVFCNVKFLQFFWMNIYGLMVIWMNECVIYDYAPVT